MSDMDVPDSPPGLPVDASADETPQEAPHDMAPHDMAPHNMAEETVEETPEEIERQIEADSTLIPRAASALLVESSVLDRAELEALLADLAPELAAALEGAAERCIDLQLQ